MRTFRVCLVALATACTDGGESGSGSFTVADSAGIEIVTNPRSSRELTLVEELRIGQLDGPEQLQFFRVGAVLPRGDRVLIANLGSSEVREFTRSGAYVRSFGGAGDGPGEYRNIALLVESGDTTVVVDGRHLRATLVGPAGEVLRAEPLVSGSVVIYPAARLPDGWLVTASFFGSWPYEVGRPRTTPVRFVVLEELRNDAPSTWDDQDSMPWPVTVEYPRQRIFGIAAGPVMTANPPLWEPAPAHAVDAAGQIHISRALPHRIEVFSPDGALRRIVRADHAPVPVTDALWNRYFATARSYFDTTTERHGEFELARAAALGREGLPRPASLPALGRIFVSRDGAIWAERPDLVEDPVLLEWARGGRQDTFWDVFRGTGERVGTVRLSRQFTPRAVTGPEIYGVLRDSLEVEHVVRLRIAEW